jgi:oligosaccharide repeat unit polymerase
MFLALACLAMLLAYCCYKATKKYAQLANPICLAAPLFGVQTVLAPVAFYKLDQLQLGESATIATVCLSGLYFGCLAFSFFLPVSPLQRPLASICPRRDAPGLRIWALLLFVPSYVALMVASGAGLLWVTSTREAYQFHRAGVGVLWAMSESLLMMSFCGFLIRQQTRVRVMLCCFCFAGAAYFLGSKGYMLIYFVLGLFYIQHRLKPLSAIALSLAALSAVSLHFGLQALQGTASDVQDAILYFDYFSNTAMFLKHFGEFGHTWGGTLLGDLWFYVPRFLYRAKPFAYGSALIMDHFNPGMAELGGTPGVLSWAGSYLDFGVIGVILQGFFVGFTLKAGYELFLGSNAAVTLIVFSQIVLGFGFPNAPMPIFFAWLAALFMMFSGTYWLLRYSSIGVGEEMSR